MTFDSTTSFHAKAIPSGQKFSSTWKNCPDMHVNRLNNHLRLEVQPPNIHLCLQNRQQLHIAPFPFRPAPFENPANAQA